MTDLLYPRLTPFIFALAFINGCLSCCVEADAQISVFGLSLSLVSVLVQACRELAHA